ncbi:MAG: hypothetical protein Q7U80_01075 [Thiobacillus sp.]|nr:hypothetical protein [Gammaproteobacteria bacterium]MBU4500158.1 hypothetical protein [Gammaproteobacteria bacterium]MDO9006787.1 hypothetical protein [Thiobacillus sp.]MDP3126281.1 hypothetical protein [Thiobacillus sp.]
MKLLYPTALRPLILLAAMASLPALAEDSPYSFNGKLGEDVSYNVSLLEYYDPGATHFDTLEAYAGVI